MESLDGENGVWTHGQRSMLGGSTNGEVDCGCGVKSEEAKISQLEGVIVGQRAKGERGTRGSRRGEGDEGRLMIGFE